MRATIFPSAIMLTKVHSAMVTMMAKGCIVTGLSTASEVFLIFTIRLYSCLCAYHAIVS